MSVATAETTAPTAAALRTFAESKNMPVGKRGPISAEIREAYAANEARKAARKRR